KQRNAVGAPRRFERSARCEEPELIAGACGHAKGTRVERRQMPVEAGAARRGAKERGDLLGVDPLAAHAAAESRIAQLAVAALANAMEDALAPVGIVALDPVREQLIDGLRKAQHHPAGA